MLPLVTFTVKSSAQGMTSMYEPGISELTELNAGIDVTNEVRMTSATGGQKGTKPAKPSLIPTPALMALAEHYGVGAKKYSAHNWRKGYEWSLAYDALCRHLWTFWDGEDMDDETGTPHMAAVAFHAFSLLVFMTEHPEFDDRPNTKQEAP